MSNYRNKGYSKGFTQVQYIAKPTDNSSSTLTEEKSKKASLTADSSAYVPADRSNSPRDRPTSKQSSKKSYRNEGRYDDYDDDSYYQNRRNDNQRKGGRNQRAQESDHHHQYKPSGDYHQKQGKYSGPSRTRAYEPKDNKIEENKRPEDDQKDPSSEDGEYKETEDFTKFKMSELSEILKDRYMKNQIECPICFNRIKKDAKIWSCQQCFGPFHLSCILKWIHKNAANALVSKNAPNQQFYTWICPKCNYNYSEELPEYKCFCTKIVNPDFDPYGIPHSCGGTCGKLRGKSCVHTCNLGCHPGPCPPCNQLGKEQSCFCGGTKLRVKCSDESSGFSCGKPCNKLLGCGKHKCQKTCHEGPCGKCSVLVDSACHCGNISEHRNCGEENFSCQEVCGRKMDCGNHTCKLICHSGPCPECPYTPEKMKTCCCGRMSVTSLGFANRKSCLDPIPVCGLPCGKKLKCGHACKKSCHPYECNDCKELVVQQCRCGKNDRKIECWKTEKGDPSEVKFICDRICRKLKSCKNHKCQNVCCDATKGNDPNGEHLCLKVCGKPLNCGKHTCEDFCHLGECKVCPIIINYPLTCSCGKTSRYPPLQCGAQPPECSHQCIRQRACGHPCYRKCHYESCAPCDELIEQPCLCERKIIKNSKCCKVPSCHAPCDTVLACGHKCGVVCHAGECNVERGIVGCGTKCGKMRECGHKCEAPCHPNNECPTDPCKVLVKIKCECGFRESFVKCSDKSTAILQCDKSCATNKRFGTFLTKDDSKKVYYPPTLVRFAKGYLDYLLKIEEKLEKMMKEGKDQMEITLYDKNINKKNGIQLLVSKHYNMDIEFYLHFKEPLIVVRPNANSKMPPMKLSEYLRQIETGKIKADILPFEATIKFYNLSVAEKFDELEYLLKEFDGEYYLEKNDAKQFMLHFWRKEFAEEALLKLKKSYTNFSQAVLEENLLLKAEEEKIIATESDVIVKPAESSEKKEENDKTAFLFLSLNSK